MKSHKPIAVFVALLVVAGMGFAFTPAVAGSLQSAGSISESENEASANVKLELRTDDPALVTDIAVGIPLPEGAMPQIVIFTGVAAKGQDIVPAVLLALEKIGEHQYRHNFLLLDGEVIRLTYKSAYVDDETRTLLVTYGTPDGDKTFVIRAYGHVFLSGEYNDYILNMQAHVFSMRTWPAVAEPLTSVPSGGSGKDKPIEPMDNERAAGIAAQIKAEK